MSSRDPIENGCLRLAAAILLRAVKDCTYIHYGRGTRRMENDSYESGFRSTQADLIAFFDGDLCCSLVESLKLDHRKFYAKMNELTRRSKSRKI